MATHSNKKPMVIPIPEMIRMINVASNMMPSSICKNLFLLEKISFFV